MFLVIFYTAAGFLPHMGLLTLYKALESGICSFQIFMTSQNISSPTPETLLSPDYKGVERLYI